MVSFQIVGGHKLQGDIQAQGAKNEALQIISATLLSKSKITIENLPDIADINKLIDLLACLGSRVERINNNTYSFQAEEINTAYLKSEEFRVKMSALRGSIMIAGPLLTRFGSILLPQPGGDKIGRRRLDTHLSGFESLGAKITYDQANNSFFIRAEKLQGSYMLLEEASVTGTANIVMAAVLAKGTTTIFNAACEPYLSQLCKMLNAMGAKIKGVGSNLLSIEGVDELGGTTHCILPDMIEVGSFIGMAAMTGSEITIKNAGIKHLGIIPHTFQRLGIKMEYKNDDIFIPGQDHYEIENYRDGSILTLADAPWPGFTPDLISIALVTATQAKGSVLIHQKMFESRLFFVDILITMGAKIILCDPHRATVIGSNKQYPLRGVQMSSPDIRAGVAMLLAAMCAKGKSIIDNAHQIDRGYEKIEERLNRLGAEIRRIEN